MADEDLTVRVIKEGYMGKKMKHNILRKVQQRYFKLLDYELLYWKKKEDADAGSEPLAYIPLKVCSAPVLSLSLFLSAFLWSTRARPLPRFKQSLY